MITVEEFRKKILIDDLDTILDTILLADGAKHVSVGNQNYIKTKLAETYKVDVSNIQLIIVGSAKLGFSLSEKKIKKGVKLKRYRLFRPDSDIDIAVISSHIFEIIWNELSNFAFSKPFLPWDSEKLGDYLVCGWLRPDHFPIRKNLRRCDDWWNIFRLLSASQRFDKRQIRGGLFYNMEQLKTYQSKAVMDCIEYEKLKKIRK